MAQLEHLGGLGGRVRAWWPLIALTLGVASVAIGGFLFSHNAIR